MLLSDWRHSSTENKKEAVKGACITKTSVRGMSEKPTVYMSKRHMMMKRKKKMKKMTNTVFNVSLPLSEGEMLLQGRTSFSADNLLESSALCLSDYDPVSSPDSETADCRLECDGSSFPVTHGEETIDYQDPPLQEDLYPSHEDAGQYKLGYNSENAYQQEDGYDAHDMCFNQFQDLTGTENNTAYEEWKYNSQHDYHEKSSNEAPMQNEEVFPAHIKEDSSYSFYTQQQSSGGTTEDASGWERSYMNTSSNAVQHYYQQQYGSQQMAWANANVPPGGVWVYHDMCGDAARNHMPAQPGSTFMQNVGVPSAPATQFHNGDQSQMQTSTLFTVNHFQAVPQNYMTQSATYQGNQEDHRLMSSINYNAGPWSNPVQHFAHPACSRSSGWGMMEGNAVIQPGQPLYHEACADVYLRAGAPFR